MMKKSLRIGLRTTVLKDLSRHWKISEAYDFTPAESSLTGNDAAPGFPGGVCKYIQTANITQEDKLMSGAYIHALFIRHVTNSRCYSFKTK